LPQANNIPKFTSRKYFERDIEDDIIKELLNKKILQIFGISGLGKTEVVKSICSKISNDFESSIWIDGSNSNSFNFESAHISKFNSNINLKNLFENHKIILILDNFNENLNELKQQFDEYNKKDSVCLITSVQENLPKNAYSLNYLSDEISKNILSETENKPSDAIANDIIKYIDGYPLLLNIIRDNVENEDDTWEVILEDIKNIVKIDDPEKNKKISIRILEKQLISIEDDIKWIFLLKSRFLSKEFLKFCIEKTGIKRLMKRSIISNTESSFYTIHQILLDSIMDILKHKVSIEDAYPKLDEFLIIENENKSVGYFNFLFTHGDFIENIYGTLDNSDSLKKQILYSKIQARNESDEVYFLEEIKNFTLANNLKIDILLVVEEIEIELYQAKKDFQKSDNEKYIEICKEKINLLEKLSSNCNIENIDLYLNHHLGKIYSRIKEYPKALELFEKVIQKDSNADYAQLQIARILSWDKENDNSDKLKKIFNEILTKSNKWEKQSLSVLLAIYDILSKYNMSKYRKEYIDDNIDDFVNRLFYSLTFGFEQPFQLLSSLSYHLSYNQKDIYFYICENLPLPSTIDTNENIKFAFATIQVAYYKNLKYSTDSDKNAKMQKAFKYAETYYKSIDLEDYQRGKFVDLYIESQKFDEALSEIKKYKQKDDAFYFQKLCKVYRGLTQYDNALQTIEKAIELLQDGKNINYLSATLNDKAETLILKKEKDEATKVLEEAIKIQSNSKTKASWNIKLTRWKNS
jgi:tetratricopeptide (TPR) repeat protein